MTKLYMGEKKSNGIERYFSGVSVKTDDTSGCRMYPTSPVNYGQMFTPKPRAAGQESLTQMAPVPPIELSAQPKRSIFYG